MTGLCRGQGWLCVRRDVSQNRSGNGLAGLNRHASRSRSPAAAPAAMLALQLAALHSTSGWAR